jgi:two-component system NtrC family sensor kinase
LRFKWSIRNKLLVCAGLLLAIVATLSWGGIHGLYAYRSVVRSLGRRVAELPLANQFAHSVSNLRVALADTRGYHDLFVAGHNAPGYSLQLAREEVRLELHEAERILAQYRERLEDLSDEDSRFNDGQEEWETLKEIDATLKRVHQLNRDVDWMLDDVRISQLTVELQHLQHLAGQLPSFLHEDIQHFTENARGQYRTLLVLSWGTTLATVLLVALVLKLFYDWVFRPLRILVKGSRKVASGQFSHRIRLETYDEMSELAAAMNDMTERFQAIRDDLDKQVQERTRQVVRGEQLASVGFLAAGVAHEINNPLASIAMCSESLEGRLVDCVPESHPDRELVATYLRMIQSEAFRCKEITEKLLDFSRIGDVQRQPHELGEITAGVINMLGHLGKYQNKQLLLRPHEPIIVNVNAQEIKQVILNLLTNALDSIDDGGTVTVEIDRHHGEGRLTVADNGCGMTPEVLEHLFEPFFTRRRSGQGTGLGLSITYRIVADHQGSIEAQSDGPGRGSRFIVRLPLASAAKEVYHRHQAA